MGRSIGVILCCLVASAATAETSPAPVQLAFAEPLQIVGEERSIQGLRFAIASVHNRDVTGFDLSGVITHTEGSLLGLQIAGANEVTGDAEGVQIAGLVSWVGGGFRGFQLSGLGARIEGGGDGVQIGGLITDAGSWRGLQLGAMNRAESLDGLQIGLLNFAGNGFLPFFPLFNFGL